MNYAFTLLPVTLNITTHSVPYPVVHFACPALQALLQPLAHFAWRLKRLNQLPRVLQLLQFHYGLQSGQVTVTRLSQGGHGQLGETLLMGQVASRYLRQSHRLHEAGRLGHASLSLEETTASKNKVNILCYA